jgi:hypothetical protein
MAKTHFRTYLSSIAIVLNSFEFVQVATNRQTGEQRMLDRSQKPRLDVTLNLFAGPEEKPIDLGTQQHIFLDKPQRAAPGNKGLPAMDAILPGSVVESWLATLDSVVDEKVPYFVDDSEESAAIGAEFHHRINLIRIDLPFGRPEQHCVSVMASVYEDKEFTRQLKTSQVNIRFCTDEFVEAEFARLSQGQQPTAADLAIFRADNNLFSLTEFVAQPGIFDGIGIVAGQFYGALKSNVDQYSAIDVQKIMTRFQSHVATMFPVAA